MAEGLKNWAGNVAYSALAVHCPASVSEVQSLVACAKRVKALGTRHSFNSIADTNCDHVSTENLNRILQLDRDRMTVKVEGGISYGTLSQFLVLEGYALHNLASLPHISVAGACATATHGSGVRNGNLATAVCALELVTASGELLCIDENDPDFHGAVVNLGALGIVTSVTLRVQPTFQVRQFVYRNLPFASLESHFDTVASSAYSVSLFTCWNSEFIDQVWVKSTDLDRPVSDSLFGARLANVKMHPLPDHSAENCTDQLGDPGSWHERLAHFKMDFTPSSGEELQSEYIIPRQHAFAALSAINSIRDVIAPVLHVSEIRTVAADDLWLSSSYGRDSVCIHFTWKKMWDVVRAILPVLEEVLAPYEARPHWGKLFAMEADRVCGLYPKMDEFKALAGRLDPGGKFRNEFLDEKVFGLKPISR
jgi:alditol oxidase